jgi:hypothetical protein
MKIGEILRHDLPMLMLKTGQVIGLRATPVDASGQPAPMTTALLWSFERTGDEAASVGVTLLQSEDGRECNVVAVESCEGFISINRDGEQPERVARVYAHDHTPRFRLAGRDTAPILPDQPPAPEPAEPPKADSAQGDAPATEDSPQ